MWSRLTVNCHFDGREGRQWWRQLGEYLFSNSEYGDSRGVEIGSGDGQWMSRKWQLVMLGGR